MGIRAAILLDPVTPELAEHRSTLALFNTCRAAARARSPNLETNPGDPVDFEIAVGHRVEGPPPGIRPRFGPWVLPSRWPPVAPRTTSRSTPSITSALRLLAPAEPD